jgi:hypothetical protein
MINCRQNRFLYQTHEDEEKKIYKAHSSLDSSNYQSERRKLSVEKGIE